MIDRLKKSFIIANGAFIEVLKFFRWLGIFFAKLIWVICPPLILIDPLYYFAIPIIAYWLIFWLSFFWDDWISPPEG